MSSDRELVATVRRVRRALAEIGPEHVGSGGDFERVSLPNRDGNALRDVLVAEHAKSFAPAD